jgi:hypothetical protein
MDRGHGGTSILRLLYQPISIAGGGCRRWLHFPADCLGLSIFPLSFAAGGRCTG